MSIVVAVHNGQEIIVASDSLSTSDKTGTKTADDSIQKVRQVNSRLVFAVTGHFVSDKLSFFDHFISVVASETELDAALNRLFDMTVQTMRVHATEGFRMSLIGFNGDTPGFRCVDVAKGKDFQALSETRRNYWVSGEHDPAEHCLRVLEQGAVTSTSSVTEIETTLRNLVTDCITRYPQTLGLPVNVVVLP
ncbi:hypothetical protein [Amycolatopsis sp. H20-H5]|uniref:hypothetical protein n=1 Tax=Amycolatopsis sp. H20-H5 TaxID=3046309 RepID=UPI002DBCD71A|nr:hypothetical protein [Amycolatopsis sp. H20-H5]MEC3976217.1 hypothetical protein [Amycolatopsis sp. H20-H5]